jgi:MinD-like ATPase involved in chromosome partitioning or flagellar assembly
LANSEQQWPGGPGPAESDDPSGADSPAGPSHSAPARPRSVWADMLISGPDDEGTPGWPASALPPSFGQRPAAGERPSFGGAGLPPAGAAYGGHHALQPRPGQADPGATEPGRADPGPVGYGHVDSVGYGHVDGPPEPESGGYGYVDGPAWPDPGYGYEDGPAQPGPGGYGLADGPEQPSHPGYGYVPSLDTDVPQPRAWASPAGSFRPWETYEAETGYEPAVGYGGEGSQDTAPPAEPEGYGASYPPPGDAPAQEPVSDGYGVVPSAGEASPGYDEPPPRYEQPAWQGGSADSLTADVLLPGRHAAPPSGWRRMLYQVTAGRVRAPQSTADRRHTDLVLRARTPVAAGHHRVAVLSLKGGVGKTTTTVGLGSTLASLRGDRIIAIDANPDRGTLCDKLRLETAATVRDLLNEEDQIRRYADVRAYTTQAASGLEVLASDRDPTVSVAFSGRDYEDVAQVLEHYYSVCVTDCGTGLLHSAMAGVLGLADQIVLVSSPSVDGARSASATLDWLAAHQYGDLVRGAVVVLSAVRPHGKSAVDLARLEQHFAARCRAVVRIPYDAYLEEGAEIDLDQLSRATADAYLVLAAEVGDGFAYPRR